MKLLLTAACSLLASCLIAQHVLDIGVNDDYDGFAFLEEAPENARVFLAGENHQFKDFNELIEEKTLRYLHRERGVRYWVHEMGASRSFLVNKAITENDTTIIELLETFSWDQDIAQYRRIMAWNDSLPQEERIQFHGVDVDHDFRTVVIALDYLLSRDPYLAHDSIRLHIESIKGYAQELRHQNQDIENTWYTFGPTPWSSDLTVQKNLEYFMKNYRAYESFYAQYLGENVNDFNRMMDCLEETLYFRRAQDDMIMHGHLFREDRMAERMSDLLLSDPEARAFGQFGRCHVSEDSAEPDCNRGVVDAFAKRLFANGPLEASEQVVTIAYIYPRYGVWRFMNPLFEQVHDIQLDFNRDDIVAVSDSQLDDSLKVESTFAYDFYILNPGPPSDAYEEATDESRRPTGMVLIGYNHQFIDAQLGTIQPYFSTLGFDIDNRFQNSFSLGIGGFSYYDDYQMFWLEGYVGDGRRIETDTSEVRFSMLSVRYEIGADVLPNSRHWNVVPWMSIGVTSWSVSFETDVALDNPAIPVSSTTSTFSVSNTSFQMGAGLDLQYEWRWGIAGIRTSGFLDPGKGRWRVNTPMRDRYNAPGAPAIKQTYWSVGCYTGFTF